MYKRIKEIWNNEKKIISFLILLTISALTYTIYIHSNISINNGFINKRYDVIFTLISISLMLIINICSIIIIKKNDIKVEKLFIILALIYGLYFLVVAPINNGSDEDKHFFRTFEVMTGQFVTEYQGDAKLLDKNVPSSFLKVIESNNIDGSIKMHNLREKFNIELNKKEIQDRIGKDGARGYSPIIYIPQSIGMSIGVLANMKPLIIINLSRIFGFLTWLIICAYAIKIMPYKKEYFLILALLPGNLTSAVTLSADTILNSTVFLMIAKIMQIIEKNENINIKDYFILLITSIIIGQCKMAYLPLIFSCLLIPMNKYKSKKDYIFGNVLIIGLSFLGTYIWLKAAAAQHYCLGEENLQEKWILNNPFKYVIIIFRTMIESFPQLFYGISAGNSMYLARVHVPDIISLGLMMCLIISLFLNENKSKINDLRRFFVLLLKLCIFLLIVTSMYISATVIIHKEIGTRIIEGLQGRYFIPILALSTVIFRKKLFNIQEKYLYILFMFLEYMVVLNVMATFI